MQIEPVHDGVAAAPSAHAGSPPVTSAAASRGFSATLETSARVAAARDVLVTLPPQVAQTLRSQPGSPVEAVDRLFEVLQDGSFTPPAGPLGGPSAIIGATARAARLFDSPAQMWDAMRSAVGQPELVRTAVDASVEAIVASANGQEPRVESIEQATAILGGPLPALQVSWWEAALWYLLGGTGGVAS